MVLECCRLVSVGGRGGGGGGGGGFAEGWMCGEFVGRGNEGSVEGLVTKGICRRMGVCVMNACGIDMVKVGNQMSLKLFDECRKIR